MHYSIINYKGESLILLWIDNILSTGIHLQRSGKTVFISMVDSTGFKRGFSSSFLIYVLRRISGFVMCFSYPRNEFLFGKSSKNDQKKILNEKELFDFWRFVFWQRCPVTTIDKCDDLPRGGECDNIKQVTSSGTRDNVNRSHGCDDLKTSAGIYNSDNNKTLTSNTKQVNGESSENKRLTSSDNLDNNRQVNICGMANNNDQVNSNGNLNRINQTNYTSDKLNNLTGNITLNKLNNLIINNGNTGIDSKNENSTTDLNTKGCWFSEWSNFYPNKKIPFSNLSEIDHFPDSPLTKMSGKFKNVKDLFDGLLVRSDFMKGGMLFSECMHCQDDDLSRMLNYQGHSSCNKNIPNFNDQNTPNFNDQNIPNFNDKRKKFKIELNPVQSLIEFLRNSDFSTLESTRKTSEILLSKLEIREIQVLEIKKKRERNEIEVKKIEIRSKGK